VGVLLAFCSFYSYSETTYNQSSNAAATGQQWTMTNVIPQNTGLSVTGIIYTYNVTKNPADAFTVSIQNKNASGTGFVFRSTDDWSGLPGNTIAKSVPVDNIPFKAWGDGEIATTGFGTVKNPVIIYNYKIDTCAATPVIDRSCPNYIPPTIDTPSIATDTATEEYIKEVMANKTKLETEEEKKQKELKKAAEEKKKKIEQIANKAIQNTLLTANAVAQADAFFAMNNIKGFESYSVSMPGGTYKDAVRLQDAKLPDNVKALRGNLTQQNLHKKMVEEQYKRFNNN